MPNISKIKAEDLQDNARLARLYQKCVKLGWWPNSDQSALDFWCLAEKALHDDKQGTPEKLFYALIKHKDLSKITDGIEKKALSRISSWERTELTESISNTSKRQETKTTLFGSNIGYMHSIMVQCFLPQQQLPSEQNRYQITHGNASLIIEGGLLTNPKKVGNFEQHQVPWGSRPRIILPYINHKAVITKKPIIDLGKSLRTFLEKMSIDINGRDGKAITQQIKNIAAAQFTLGEWREDGSTTRRVPISDEVSFWIEQDEKQNTLWNPEMILSPKYFEALMERHVPINMEHLLKLSRSPRRMDIYTWLSYRTISIKPNKITRIQLQELHKIFGPDITLYKTFKQRFKQDLAQIAKIHNGFKIEIENDLLLMQQSRSPIQTQTIRKISH